MRKDEANKHWEDRPRSVRPNIQMAAFTESLEAQKRRRTKAETEAPPTPLRPFAAFAPLDLTKTAKNAADPVLRFETPGSVLVRTSKNGGL